MPEFSLTQIKLGIEVLLILSPEWITKHPPPKETTQTLSGASHASHYNLEIPSVMVILRQNQTDATDAVNLGTGRRIALWAVSDPSAVRLKVGTQVLVISQRYSALSVAEYA